MTPFPDLTFYRLWRYYWIKVSIWHLQRVWHADRGRLLLQTPGPVPLGLAYVLLVETNPFPNLSLFYRTMLFEYRSVLSRFCSFVYLLQVVWNTFWLSIWQFPVMCVRNTNNSPFWGVLQSLLFLNNISKIEQGMFIFQFTVEQNTSYSLKTSWYGFGIVI